MRRRLAALVAATTIVVVVAFFVPLALLVRTLAEDRAMSTATQEAQNVAVVAAVVTDPAQLRSVIDLVNGRSTRRTTVYLPDGRIVGPDAAPRASLALARSGQAFTTATAGGREVYVPVTSPAGRTVVRTFVPAALLREGVARAVLVLGLLGAALLVMAVLFADRLARWMLRPVTALAGTANRLGSGDLTARVAPEGPPEIAKVGQALNRLADRITDLLRHEREIVADLSHRLRTPLAALRLDVEGLRNPDEAVRLGDHMDALQRMVDDVIVQARRPERADRAGAADQCDAVAVVRDRVAFWAVLAEDTGREFRLLLPGIARPVPVPAHDLAAAVDALLENVFAHTPDGTSMSVWIDAAAERTQIIVSDDGPGLPSPAVAGRGHSRGGSTGLGLDIARRIARGSGGTLLLGASPTGGAEVVLDLGPVRA